MQIKFLSLATLAVLFAAVSAAPTSAAPGYTGPGQEGSMQDASGPDASTQQGNVAGSGNEAAFNARVVAIQNDPEIKNTLEFLIQQISGKLNEGSSHSG